MFETVPDEDEDDDEDMSNSDAEGSDLSEGTISFVVLWTRNIFRCGKKIIKPLWHKSGGQVKDHFIK